MWEIIRSLDLWQQKKEETIWYQKETIIHNFFSGNLLETRMRKTQILINKPVWLDLKILK